MINIKEVFFYSEKLARISEVLSVVSEIKTFPELVLGIT